MATFAEIKEVRLTISDPQGFIDILQVANFAGLPTSQIAQTVYNALDSGTYYDKSTGAWVPVLLRVADSRIGTWIDSFGIEGAVRKCIEAILSGLPSEMMIVKNTDGAESTEFLKLLDLQKFYQNWLASLSPPDAPAATGLYVRTVRPCIAGGNV